MLEIVVDKSKPYDTIWIGRTDDSCHYLGPVREGALEIVRVLDRRPATPSRRIGWKKKNGY